MTAIRKRISNILLILAGAGAVFLMRPTLIPGLSVLLRCAPQVEGNVTIGGAALREPLTLSVSDACAKGEITFDSYIRDTELFIRYQSDTVDAVQLDLQQVEDIQSSNGGNYYVLIDVTATPPFITVGRI